MTSIEDRLIGRVDGMRDEIIKHVGELVRIPSVNPRYPGTAYDDVVGGEGQAARYMAGLFEDAGAKVSLIAPEPGRDNAVGVLEGDGGGRSLIFNGHVDVVPPGDEHQWQSDPFAGGFSDNRIWGRGAADQKGGLVAQAMAAVALSREGVRLGGDLLLEAVVGEEVMDHEAGVSAVIGAGFTADAAIVSEPSGPPRLGVIPATPGNLWFSITVRGKAVHASVRRELVREDGGGSRVGVNALEKAVFVIMPALQQLEQEWGSTKQHPLWRPGQFVIHPGVIDGGPTGARVPFITSDYCTVEYAAWFPPDEGVDRIKAELVDRVISACQLDPWLREHPPEIEWKMYWPALDTPQDHPIVQTLEAAHRAVVDLTPSVGPSEISGWCAVCDATFLSDAGIPSVIYGPGSLLQAHMVDEWLDADELVTATMTLAVTAYRWCAGVG